MTCERAEGAPGPGWPRERPGPRSSAEDLAAFFLALGLGHLQHAFALARVLAGAAVARARARAVALALVDADALDCVATPLFLGADLNGSACQERRGGGRDQDALVDAIHGSPPVPPERGEHRRPA